MTDLPDLHVLVKFGKGIPVDDRGSAMMALERRLREASGLNCEVFMETMGDDLKSRAAMTPEQRAKL